MVRNVGSGIIKPEPMVDAMRTDVTEEHFNIHIHGKGFEIGEESVMVRVFPVHVKGEIKTTKDLITDLSVISKQEAAVFFSGELSF